MNITYITGDATRPIGEGPKVIVHNCNDIGSWGKGFVMALSKRWPEPEQRYRAWHRGEELAAFALGEVQFVQVSEAIWVANLIGQRDIRPLDGLPTVRYEAIRKGLRRIAKEAHDTGASVHMPRIGCGLAGGNWEEISQIVEQELLNKGLSVTVYDLPS